MSIQNTIQQICIASGLQGADLEALKTRLAKMSQAELQAELTKALCGEGLKETKGGYFERTIPAVQANIKQNFNNKADLTLEQAQALSIEYIFENIRNATNVYMNMDPGLVGYGYDQLKNFFETEFSSKNVYEVILKEEDCANFLSKAQEGSLTKREYYEQNKLRLKEMLFNRFKQIDETGVDAIDKYRGSIPRKEFEQIIENYIVAKINSIQTMEGIKEFQHKLIIASDEDENELIKNLAESAKAQINDEFSPKDTTSIVNLDLMPKEGKSHPYDSDEKMTFEETYLLERGVEFNETKIENLMQAKGEMSLIQGAYNKLQGLKSTTKEILKQYQKDSEPLYDESGNILQEREPKVEPRLENIEDIINEYYAASPDNGTLVIDDINRRLQLNLNFGLNSEGKIEIGFNDFHQTDASKNKSLNLLLRELSRMQEKQFNELCGDKTLEEYISDYENSYAYSMGEQNVEELSRAMVEDNINFVDKTTGTISTVGMGLLLLGGAVVAVGSGGTATPLVAGVVALAEGTVASGTALAMGGMAARNLFGFADTWKMKSGFSEDDMIRRSKDLVMDLGGLTVGAYVGKISLQKALEVARNGGSQAMAMIAEHGTDFTLSLAGDLAMIGALNYDQGLAQTIKQNGIGILVSTVTGIKASKQMFAQGKVEYAFDVVMPRQDADGMNIVQRMNEASESAPTKPKMGLEAEDIGVRKGKSSIADEVRMLSETEVATRLDDILKFFSEAERDEVLSAIENVNSESIELKNMVLNLLEYKKGAIQQGLESENIDISRLLYSFFEFECSESSVILDNKQKLYKFIGENVNKVGFSKMEEFVDFLTNNIDNSDYNIPLYISKIDELSLNTINLLRNVIKTDAGSNPYAKTDFVAQFMLITNIDTKYLNYLNENPYFTEMFARWGVIIEDDAIMKSLINEFEKSKHLSPEIIAVLDQYKMCEHIQDISPEMSMRLEEFLNEQKIETEIVVQRGEDFGFVDSIYMGEKTLGEILRESENLSPNEIKALVESEISQYQFKSNRFISTTFNPAIAEHFADNIVWNLVLQPGTKGCVIDIISSQYNYEAEFLLQKNS